MTTNISISFYSRFADITEIINDNARSPITPLSSDCYSNLPPLKPFVRCRSPPKRVQNHRSNNNNHNHNSSTFHRRSSRRTQASEVRNEVKSSLSFPPSHYRNSTCSNSNNTSRYQYKIVDDTRTNSVSIPILIIQHHQHHQSVQLPYPMLATASRDDDVSSHDVAPKMPCRRSSGYQSTYDYMSEALNISNSIEEGSRRHQQ